MTSYGEARLTDSPRANLVDDLTTISGLILAYGALVMIGGTVDLAGAAYGGYISNDWDGNPSNGVFSPILGLLANLTVTIFGLVSLFLGFQYVACRWGSKLSALVGLCVTLAAWFPFLVTVSLIAFQAEHGNVAGAPLLISHPTVVVSTSEINAIAAIGILGFYGYAGTVIGALTFLQWKMYRFFEGAPSTYTAAYYRSRLSYYGFLSLLAGTCQLALGAYVQNLFGWGQLSVPVVAGPFFILWPEISITVGICQVLYSFLIIYRSTTPGVGPATGNKDKGLFMFQVVAWSVFLISMGGQVLGQVSLNESNSPALFIGNVLGVTLFPIYLDAVAHTTPENVTPDMFSASKDMSSRV